MITTKKKLKNSKIQVLYRVQGFFFHSGKGFPREVQALQLHITCIVFMYFNKEKHMEINRSFNIKSKIMKIKKEKEESLY